MNVDLHKQMVVYEEVTLSMRYSKQAETWPHWTAERFYSSLTETKYNYITKIRSVVLLVLFQMLNHTQSSFVQLKPLVKILKNPQHNHEKRFTFLLERKSVIRMKEIFVDTSRQIKNLRFQQSIVFPHSFSSLRLHSGLGFQVIPLCQSASENMVDLFVQKNKNK